jgi:serine/threonine protein kinase
LHIGSSISHYKIVEKLGEGGMGVVYKAEDTTLDRLVALKFLADHLLNDAEAKAAAALHHPNLCPVHEFAEANGKTFISMAYIEGEMPWVDFILMNNSSRGLMKMLAAIIDGYEPTRTVLNSMARHAEPQHRFATPLEFPIPWSHQ